MTEYLFHLTQGRGIEQQTTDTDHKYLYDDTSQYLPKNSPLFVYSVLKVLCYQNICTEKHGRNVHMHKFIGDNNSE